jgi:hypothetical protein
MRDGSTQQLVSLSLAPRYLSLGHGPTLMVRSLGYLATARGGLTADEVLDVLSTDDVVWNDFDKRKHHEVSERRLPGANPLRLVASRGPGAGVF